MLELAREHALERIQFGVPISSFQAVRHRLAETLVAIETADAVLDAAWLDGSPATAAMAKAVAGREARTAARHCQQVLAGIGFTTEHTFHRYVRRVLVLDALFGTSRTLTRSLGDDLLATRRLPRSSPSDPRARPPPNLCCEREPRAQVYGTGSGSALVGAEAGEVRPELRGGERAVLGGEREVERGQRRLARGGG